MEAINTSAPIHVLLVDDNEPYRQAFRRNLTIQGFGVTEAGNADEALAIIQESAPDVVVTDLQMRTRTEGLDLIRQARGIDPLLPIIMISAVGSFEEGAMASRLGAMHVIEKSKIEEEITRLYSLIRSAHQERIRSKALLYELETIRAGQGSMNRLTEILGLPGVSDYVKSEAFETWIALSGSEMLERSRATVASQTGAQESLAEALARVDKTLEQEVNCYTRLTPESREALRTAEFLFQQEFSGGPQIDFSRNIGFSYCFSVENEAKEVMGRKVQRMLMNLQLNQIISQLLEKPSNHLGIFFHQALLQVQRTHPMSFSIDNVRQVFMRILEYGENYKPDGLKALAILVLCFGRNYSVRTARATVEIKNLLALKGFDNEEEIIVLAQRLARLQHYRNPFIHPEISDLEKIPAIRSETFACLEAINRIV